MGHGKRPQFDWGKLETIFGGKNPGHLGKVAEVAFLRKEKGEKVKEFSLKGKLAGSSITPSGLRQICLGKWSIPFLSLDIAIKSVALIGGGSAKHRKVLFDLGLFAKIPDTEEELAELARYYFG